MKNGLTLIEVVILIGITVFLAFLFLPFYHHTRRRSGGSKCKSNLKQLGTGMHLYTERFGRSSRYPDRNGTLFLCRLYITDVFAESSIFICPGTADDNDRGHLLTEANFVGGDRNNVCSYAGRNNANQDQYPGIFTSRNSSQTTMAGDDWGDGQDGAGGYFPYNHPDMPIFLFIDGHSSASSAEYDEEFMSGRLTDPLGN